MKRLILLLLIPLFACSHLERNKTTMKYLSLIAVLICSYVQAYWELIPGTESLEVWLLESDGRRLYAISDTGFYLSFDDGFTWRHRDIGRGIDDFYISAIGSGDGAVYVGTVDHGVFRSDDGGNTWKHINEGLHIFDDPKRGPRHGIVYQLLVTSSGMVINVGYHQGTHISRNRGDSWRDVTLEWKASPRTGKPRYHSRRRHLLHGRVRRLSLGPPIRTTGHSAPRRWRHLGNHSLLGYGQHQPV